MKKIAFSGFMASILMITGAAFAAGETNTASLTTKGYVDKGLRDLYSAVGSKLGSGANGYDIDAKTLKVGGADVLTSADIADKADVTTVTALSSAIADKADADDLTALSSTVAGKADASSVYTKAEIDEAGFLTTADVADKADATTVTALSSTVNALSTAVSSKADATTVTALSSTVAGKADANSVYTKTEIDNAGYLTSADVAVYTGTGLVTVDANHQISLNTDGLDSTAMYVFKDGAWSELDINGTFPTDFNFAGE